MAKDSKSIALLRLYRELADGLSDMVEGGRLSESDIPDDYQWLGLLLEKIAGMDPGNPVPREQRTPRPVSQPEYLKSETPAQKTPPPAVKRFDAYLIRPAVCYKVEANDLHEVCEQCETWPQALNMAGEYSGRACWKLYGHIATDGLDEVAECQAEDDARVLLYKLTGIIATPGNPGPYMAAR